MLSGPVTESNGLRERIGSALVACGVADPGAAGSRATRGGTASVRLVGAEAGADDVHDPLRVEERRRRHERDDHRPEVALEELVEGHAVAGWRRGWAR